MALTVAEALGALMQTDPAFTTDMRAATLGTGSTAAVPKVIVGNTPFEQLGQEHYPCWVFDAGDAEAMSDSPMGDASFGLVIGTSQQDWSSDIEIALVWSQQDRATAVAQRDALRLALVRLLLRNPGVGGAGLAYVVRVLNDRSGRHPTHVAGFVVRVHTTIYRDEP